MTNETVPREWWDQLSAYIYDWRINASFRRGETENSLHYALQNEQVVLCEVFQREMRRIEEGEK